MGMGNRYLLFAGAEYYPEGGYLDYGGAFTTEASARRQFTKVQEYIGRQCFGHVYDKQTDTVIAVWCDTTERWMET